MHFAQAVGGRKLVSMRPSPISRPVSAATPAAGGPKAINVAKVVNMVSEANGIKGADAGHVGVYAGKAGASTGNVGTDAGKAGASAGEKAGAGAGKAGAGASERAGRLRSVQGPAMMLTSALSNQCGAAIGALAFPVIGPAGVVAVRQWVAAAVMLAAGRPRLRSFTWPQWWPVLLLAAVFGTMNLSLYTAIDKLGLGLAVTLEFLGPLSVALATSRRRIDIGCALLAGAGVVVLTRPRPSTDYLGVGLALLAAACWASYILLNRVIGRRLPGVQGPAAASALSALAFVPVGVVVALRHPPTLNSLACAAAAGLLASALPYLVDLLALRRVPAHSFGTFMSVNPVLAAIIGFLILGQSLPWLSWLSIAAIAGANALSAITMAKQQPSPPASSPAHAGGVEVSGQTSAAGGVEVSGQTSAAGGVEVSGQGSRVGSPPCESSSSDPAAVSTP
jgi:inner membrane transporter RhtA